MLAYHTFCHSGVTYRAARPAELVRVIVLDALANEASEIWIHRTRSLHYFDVEYLIFKKTVTAMRPALKSWSRLQDGIQSLASLPLGEPGRQQAGSFTLKVGTRPSVSFTVDVVREPTTGTRLILTKK